MLRSAVTPVPESQLPTAHFNIRSSPPRLTRARSGLRAPPAQKITPEAFWVRLFKV